MTVSTTVDNDYLEARAKEEARIRRQVYRRTWIDQRTRVARRARSIESQLRAQLRKQGRAITIADDMLVASLARATVELELLTGAQSRGEVTDLEQTTRALNVQQRLVSALGLRPADLEPPQPPKPRPSLGALIRDNHGA